jgi:hypothetical protein
MPLAFMEQIENNGVQTEETCAFRAKLGDGWERNAA